MLNLKSWHRKALIILGAVIGGIAVHSLLRWRAQGQKHTPKNATVPPQPDSGNGEV